METTVPLKIRVTVEDGETETSVSEYLTKTNELLRETVQQLHIISALLAPKQAERPPAPPHVKRHHEVHAHPHRHRVESDLTFFGGSPEARVVAWSDGSLQTAPEAER